jgi:hypothetical protein
MATEARQGWIRRTMRRLAPVGDKPIPPDHAAFIRPDYSLCCAWHEAHSFRPSPEATQRLHQQVGGLRRVLL